MFCQSCGAPRRDDARFCARCGAALANEVDSTLSLAGEPPGSDVPESLRAALAPAFEVRRLLGRGGMGAVYLALESSLDRLVAIKVLTDSDEDPSRSERFLAEARLAAKLRHPNIVTVHAVGVLSGVRYLAMEFVEGDTLDAHVRKKGSLSPQEARAILVDVSRAVAHAHRNGVVHRDLKPSNIMVEPSGRVVVMDFGLAKHVGSAGLTSEGVVVGTPSYISPEQLQGEPASRLSDVYAIGLVYFFLLAGRPLVRGEDVTAVVAQHLTADLESRVLEEPAVPAAARKVLLGMIQRATKSRTASLDDVLAALEAAPTPSAARGRLESGPTETITLSSPASPLPARTPSPSPIRKQARARIKGLLDKLEKRDE